MFIEFDERMKASFNREGEIYNALRRITPHQSWIFILRLGSVPEIYEGPPMSRRQVGEYLGLKPSSVGSVERRGLRKLRASGFPEEPIRDESGAQMEKFDEKSLADDPDRSKRTIAKVLEELHRPLITELRRVPSKS